MAKKRFTDIEIWDKEWYMELSPKHKCLMKYIFDKCDAAGCWKPNWKLASLHINDDVQFTDLSYLPNDQYELLENGKIFIPDFVNFQYGTLSEKSPAHNPVFIALEKNNLSNRVFNRVCNTPKEKDKEKDKEEEKGNGKKNDDSEFWFMRYYREDYDFYKAKFNGQSTSEILFYEWKKFIDFIYEKNLVGLFKCGKFISPHSFGELVVKEKFTSDKWEIPLRKILATGVKPEHDLFFRIPEFISYSKNKNGTDQQQIGRTKNNAGALDLLNNLKGEIRPGG